MPLANGVKLGPYEIIAPLGAGGMGEVYRAKDTRLDRTVAIKVLPQHLADTPEARQRFEREARAVSALSHPNICTLYDVGSQNGAEYLVMEYLEGETLAARLEKGALPLDQTLKIGIEIADALEKAHRQGIIHRDLKPGNIMLTKSGAGYIAKLLDFGLAKAVESVPVSGLTVAETSPPTRDPVTDAGVVLGTYQYMAPEIIEGLEADARVDIFSFGAVLYEMATGKRAFDGKTQASVLAAVLASDPKPISSTQPASPASLDRVVKFCLAKDRDERWQSAHDVKLELQWIAEGGSEKGLPSPAVARDKRRERIAWAIAAIAILTAMALAIFFPRGGPKPQQSIQVSADLGAAANIQTEFSGPNAILSPDGAKLVFAAQGSDKKRRLYIRPLDQLQATVLAGTEDATQPFFSPDSQWIAFFADGKLKKISVHGGAPEIVCDSRAAQSGSWGDDGNIIFANRNDSALSKVSSSGGAPAPFTTLDKSKSETSQHWPQVLPGSKVVIYTSQDANTNSYEDVDIVAYSAASGQAKTILHGGFHAIYLQDGFLVYMHSGTLFAIPFDSKRLETTGPATAVVENVVASPDRGTAQFSISDNGTLAYVAGSAVDRNLSIYWMDAGGNFTPLRETPADYGSLALSPDGKRLAMDIRSSKRTDIWIYDLERDTLTRLTFAADGNFRPVWTPNGERIVYNSSEKGKPQNLWWIRSDGGGSPERLTQSDSIQISGSWTPDGKTFAFAQRNPGTGMDVMTLSVDGNEKTGWKPGQPKAFLNTPFFETDPEFSPDGRWIAYISNESGANEIYVRPFPGPGGKTQISTGGGSVPQWSRTGKELYYIASTRDKIMAVTYSAIGDSFRAEKPRVWSTGQISERGSYFPGPDGKRIGVLKSPGAIDAAPINKVEFIFNFTDQIRTKLSASATK
jgi:serine/threonine protein kinase/Tol biopolymer transport system component